MVKAPALRSEHISKWKTKVTQDMKAETDFIRDAHLSDNSLKGVENRLTVHTLL